MDCVIVLVPPLAVIGEVVSGFGKKQDDVLGTGDAVLKDPAIIVWTPGNINYQGFGKELHFPNQSIWPWRDPTADELKGYEKFKAAASGLVLPVGVAPFSRRGDGGRQVG